MVTIPIIGIAGKARTGKDTAAEVIIALRGFGYRYGFADPISWMLRGIGIDDRDSSWDGRKEEAIPALGVSLRHLKQTLGTEWGRNLVHPDLWVIMAKQTLITRGPGMVISDVRFENEATWIRDVGGVMLHLRRSGAPEVRRHESEDGIEVAPTDFVIHNDGTLDDFRYKLGSVVEAFSGE